MDMVGICVLSATILLRKELLLKLRHNILGSMTLPDLPK